MPRIVDGDNLLGSWPGRNRSDGERRALVRELARLVHREGRRIVVVFDGPEPPGLPAGADVLFSGAARKADDLILGVLREQRDRRGWTLVTNDRSLGDQARYLGARVERCDVFRERLLRQTDREKPEAGADARYWSEVFGVEDEVES